MIIQYTYLLILEYLNNNRYKEYNKIKNILKIVNFLIHIYTIYLIISQKSRNLLINSLITIDNLLLFEI